MGHRYWILAVFLFFSFHFSSSANGDGQLAPPLPSRIGGTVMVGKTAAAAIETKLTFKVTKQDGSAYDPVAEDADGVNSSNWYLLDIPIYNATDQPGGANPGDTAVIHVYVNGQEIPVSSPTNGALTVGSAGSTTQLNIVVYAPTLERIPAMGEWGAIVLAASMAAVYIIRREKIRRQIN